MHHTVVRRAAFAALLLSGLAGQLAAGPSLGAAVPPARQRQAAAPAEAALLHGWLINLDRRVGSYTLSGGQTGANLADIQLTQQNALNVYVHATGIPAYAIGPFGANPATPDEQTYRFRLPKTPAEQTNAKTPTGLGPIGVLVNGVPVYSALDAFSWSASLQRDAPTNGQAGNRGDGVWNRNANVVEAPGFDSCRGHPAPGQTPANGRYHNHDDPICLRDLLGDDGARHSPIIGWAFDGFPLYGPHGYADPLDPASPARQIASAYRARAITQRTTRPDGAALPANHYGPPVSAQYPLGYYVEDFEYVAGLGDLDRFNGRFAVTPEYPDGTYAYVLTLGADGASSYPYMIGPAYYGIVAADNLGAGQVAIPADATVIAPQRLFMPLALK